MHIVCAACGSENLKHVKETDFYNHNDDRWSFDAVQCQDCDEVTLITYASLESVEHLIGS